MAHKHYDLEKKSRDVRSMERDMKYSRSAFVTWGKEIVFAIDSDHAGRLIYTLKSKKHLGADMDAQTTKNGYGGYSWSVYIHNFLGDTAMHLALRQKKYVCAHALLILGARTDIPNNAGVTQEELIFKMTGKTLQLFRRETERELVSGMNPYDLHLLPDNLIYRGLDRQAWNLMLDGRNEYTKLPKNADKLTDPPLDNFTAHNENEAMETKQNELQVTSASVLEQDDGNSVDVDREEEDGKNYLKSVIDKHTSALGLLASSVGSISSYEKAADTTHSSIRENGFCFNDIRDVEEFVISQNALLFRLDREERLKVSGLSLLKTTEVDDNQTDDDETAVTRTTQNLLKNAAKSFKNFKYLQRAMALEETEETMTCLDMPYRHLTKLSTRTNMIHMNIGDKGMRRICRHLPGNYMITDLVLSNARITATGLRFLCDALTFMDNMFYLDLSQNCIDDRGTEYLSDLLGEGSLSSCPSLRKISLLGNRITVEGAKLITESALTGSLEYLNLCNNRITPPEVEALQQLVETRRRMSQNSSGGDGDGDGDCDDVVGSTSKHDAEKKIMKTILFDNLLRPKIISGYGGY